MHSAVQAPILTRRPNSVRRFMIRRAGAKKQTSAEPAVRRSAPGCRAADSATCSTRSRPAIISSNPEAIILPAPRTLMKKKLSIGSWAFIFNQEKPTNDFHQVVHMLSDLGYEGVELGGFN